MPRSRRGIYFHHAPTLDGLTCHERCSHSVLCLSRLLGKPFPTAGASLLGAPQVNRMACLGIRNASTAPNSIWRRWSGPEAKAFPSLDLRAAYAAQSADRGTLCCCSVCQRSGRRVQCERPNIQRSQGAPKLRLT